MHANKPFFYHQLLMYDWGSVPKPLMLQSQESLELENPQSNLEKSSDYTAPSGESFAFGSADVTLRISIPAFSCIPGILLGQNLGEDLVTASLLNQQDHIFHHRDVSISLTT